MLCHSTGSFFAPHHAWGRRRRRRNQPVLLLLLLLLLFLAVQKASSSSSSSDATTHRGGGHDEKTGVQRGVEDFLYRKTFACFLTMTTTSLSRKEKAYTRLDTTERHTQTQSSLLSRYTDRDARNNNAKEGLLKSTPRGPARSRLLQLNYRVLLFFPTIFPILFIRPNPNLY